MIMFSVANARNVALVWCVGLIFSRSNVVALVLKNRCKQVVIDKSGSKSLRKESSRVFSGVTLLPPYSILQGH